MRFIDGNPILGEKRPGRKENEYKVVQVSFHGKLVYAESFELPVQRIVNETARGRIIRRWRYGLEHGLDDHREKERKSFSHFTRKRENMRKVAVHVGR